VDKFWLRSFGAVLVLCVFIISMSRARAQSGSRLAQIPGISTANCHPGPGPRPWANKNQTPECRALEVIPQLTTQEKLGFLSYAGGKVERLGIVTPRTDDGPNGVADHHFGNGPFQPLALNVTAFPNVVALAATWDRSLAKQFGTAVGQEFRDKGLGSDLGPTVNILRTWHWARAGETFGEDPYLTSQMVVPEVLGMQSQKVIAVVKHFAANDQDYGRVGRNPHWENIDEHITQKALHEIYLPAFKAAVQKGHAGAIMCAYDQINGQFSCNNAWLLGNLRRWGFNGYIIPDAGFAQRSPLAAGLAGVDDLSPASEVEKLIQSGKLPADTLDKAVFHFLTSNFQMGIYDDPPRGNANANVSTAAHVRLSEQIAADGAVLLKNQGNVLPLTSKVKSIAVIGDDAGPHVLVMETGSPEVHVMPASLSVPLNAIRARAGQAVKVTYARGTLGIGPLPAIPTDCLTPPSGSQGHGLLAQYYSSGDWSGAPVVTRVDPTINFAGLPVPQLAPAHAGRGMAALFRMPLWSATWNGTLVPTATGTYVFSVTGGGTAELYVNDRAVVSMMAVDMPRTSQGTIRLYANHPVPIELKYSSESNLLGRGIQVGWAPPDPRMMQQAVDAARQADVAIVFAAKSMGEGHDDITLELPGDQNALIEAVARANPHTIVVLHTSNPVAMPWLDHVAAVIEAWYPGEEAGDSLAEVLFGDVDPSGRLPMTFPRNMHQGPATNFLEYPGDFFTVNFDEGVLVGYRWYDAKHQKPLFPFGFGLSYTTFKYSDPRLSGSGVSRTATVTVTNTGSRAGADVAELYLAFPPAAKEPPRQLKGFEKVSLNPGQSKTVSFSLNRSSFSAWDSLNNRWRVYGGTYTVEIGSSSSDILLESPLELSGQVASIAAR
jgi:beta-glucosidase